MGLNRRTLLETFAGVLAAGTMLQAAEVQSVLLDPHQVCLLYTSPSPRDGLLSRMPSSA